ncbi:MAG TPA: DUF2125 domain-containing protein [Caulobacteraceae bacterium]|nr:DUF2125 domain-containing protein [Caulobacteraceae bacterium]
MPSDSASPQTHSVRPPAGKSRRLWLLAPYAVLVILGVVWSLAWLWMIGEAQRRMDGAASSLRTVGWTVAWDRRHVGGYPFRLDVDFTGLRIADPSGWALATRSLKTEAYAFAPGNWVFYAPEGLTFSRPDGGPVNVTARALRGSVGAMDEAPPRISLEGDDLAFAAGPGAKPFSLAIARNLQAYTRAGPQQQAALFASLDGGVARPDSLMGRIAGGQPVTMRLDGVISHTDRLSGESWRSLVQHWSANGGTFDVHQLTLSAGAVVLSANKGSLAVADNGQVEGVLEATLRDQSRVMAVMQDGHAPATDSGAHDPIAPLRLTFRDGGTWLGPLRLAPAPRAY